MSETSDATQAPAKPREVMVKLQSLVNSDPHSWEDAWCVLAPFQSCTAILMVLYIGRLRSPLGI